jgi:hypothetical protein
MYAHRYDNMMVLSYSMQMEMTRMCKFQFWNHHFSDELVKPNLTFQTYI